MTDSDREKRIEKVLAKWTGVRGGGPALSPRLYAGLAVDALGPFVPLERAQDEWAAYADTLNQRIEELERERDEVRESARLLYGVWACLVGADSVLSLIVHRYASMLPEDVRRDAGASYAECRRMAERIKPHAERSFLPPDREEQRGERRGI